MRILITGAAGLYGVHLVDELLRRRSASRIFALDNFSRSFLARLPFCPHPQFAARVEVLERDFRALDARALDAMELDAVVHLAARVSIDESMVTPREYFEVNEFGTFHLCQALLHTQRRPFLLYASSPEVYGAPRRVPMDEEHPLHPKSTYAATKLAAEKHCLTLHEWHGYPVAAIRNFNTFGENQNLAFYPAVIPHFIRLALLGEPLTLHSSGRQNRDFLYVRDAARAYALALEQSHRIRGEIFNIGSGQGTSIRDVAELILRHTVSRSRLVNAPGRGRGDLPGLCADITRIRQMLGWSPQFPLEEALARTVKWYRRHIPQRRSSRAAFPQRRSSRAASQSQSWLRAAPVSSAAGSSSV